MQRPPPCACKSGVREPPWATESARALYDCGAGTRRVLHRAVTASLCTTCEQTISMFAMQGRCDQQARAEEIRPITNMTGSKMARVRRSHLLGNAPTDCRTVHGPAQHGSSCHGTKRMWKRTLCVAVHRCKPCSQDRSTSKTAIARDQHAEAATLRTWAACIQPWQLM